ncbi:MAG: hypothetical protein JWQ34_329 [Mucilaginibacter sp.]|uniref:hypothetical protein n=1 Tax=Mucilaginibacter sp. TaxID=1882438 RepID=UPI002606DA61|nr:hypothetical protein [Mucilaginibacter sp.]MDB5002104.1 hypothetical protein [Mucilaginibacter sp.]
MKFQTKTTHKLSCTTSSPLISSAVVIFLFFATSCGQQKKDKTQDSLLNKSDQAIRSTDGNSYLKYSERLINQLDDKKKAARQTALNELKSNSTYIELVNNQSVDQRYLKALQAIGECMISLKKMTRLVSRYQQKMN